MPASHRARVELKDIAELKPYPRNARIHSKRQIKQLARSIARFGFLCPILIDANNQIIAGHARTESARLLGRKRIPTLTIDGLTEAERRAYILADNRLAQNADWDRAALAVELKELIDLDFEIDLIGFETPEVDLLLEELELDEPGHEDAVPQVASGSPISEPGDLWCLGDHRLLCGDATQPAAYRQLLGRSKTELVVTDPPFNLKIDGHVSGLGRTRHKEFAMASGEMSEGEFIAFLETVFALIARHSINGSIVYSFMDWRHIHEILTAGRRTFTELKNVCVWTKPQAGMGTFYRSQHELVFVWKNGTAPHINNFELGQHGRYRSNVWTSTGSDVGGPTRLEALQMHPTVKPVSLVQNIILDCSQRGGLVHDPFCGSGTILVAAERAGRKARTMEIDPRFVDLSIRRWQSYTGERAIHAETGRPFQEVENQPKRRTRR
jgi:DNA modification methylase